ncbi:helix-turn-helix domain-containing protein [Longispora sp. NPDC051575]|uniref:TetR/AcrR family transcriptional regulator n=1 Tax=Longispora sp. NPDC051575 TaxID=3154943 RepID=UPI00343FC6C3
MGYKHSRDQMLDAAARLLAEEGLAGVTFRRIGERLGVPDRTVVYYFPTKSDLLGAVLDGHVRQLHGLLHAALGDRPLPPAELLHRAWSALRTPGADALFRVHFEVAGQAAAGRAPYRALAAALAAHWADWLSPRVAVPVERRNGRAAALLAQLDGLLLLRAVGQAALADTAATELGWRR